MKEYKDDFLDIIIKIILVVQVYGLLFHGRYYFVQKVDQLDFGYYGRSSNVYELEEVESNPIASRIDGFYDSNKYQLIVTDRKKIGKFSWWEKKFERMNLDEKRVYGSYYLVRKYKWHSYVEWISI